MILCLVYLQVVLDTRDVVSWGTWIVHILYRFHSQAMQHVSANYTDSDSEFC